MAVPSGGEKLSFADIQSQRQHVVEIINPNGFLVRDMVLMIQFPEAILSVLPAEPSPGFEVKATGDVDRQPLSISGERTDSLTVESPGPPQATGLWRVRVNVIKRRSRVGLRVVTTSEKGIYNAWATDPKTGQEQGELRWLIEGTYEYDSKCRGPVEEQIAVPLTVDWQRRSVYAGAVVKGPLREDQKVHV